MHPKMGVYNNISESCRGGERVGRSWAGASWVGGRKKCWVWGKEIRKRKWWGEKKERWAGKEKKENGRGKEMGQKRRAQK